MTDLGTYEYLGKISIGQFYFIFTLFAVGLLTNSYNYIDGVDGLAGGISLVCATVFSIIAFVCGDVFVLLINLSVLGSLDGFLKFNFSMKNRIPVPLTSLTWTYSAPMIKTSALCPRVT